MVYAHKYLNNKYSISQWNHYRRNARQGKTFKWNAFVKHFVAPNSLFKVNSVTEQEWNSFKIVTMF